MVDYNEIANSLIGTARFRNVISNFDPRVIDNTPYVGYVYRGANPVSLSDVRSDDILLLEVHIDSVSPGTVWFYTKNRDNLGDWISPDLAEEIGYALIMAAKTARGEYTP